MQVFSDVSVVQDAAASATSIGWMGWYNDVTNSFSSTQDQSTSFTGEHGISATNVFVKHYERNLTLSENGSIPVFVGDDAFISNSEGTIPAIGLSIRSAQLFHSSSYLSRRVRDGAFAKARYGSLLLPESSPMAYLCSYCLYASRWLPR